MSFHERTLLLRGSRHARRGVSLIEAVVSIVLVSTALPAMLVFVRDAQVRRASPILAGTARWIAAEKLEDIIADRHSTTRGWSYVAENNYPDESSVAGFPGFARAVEITETGPTLSGGGTGYRVVNVVVSWIDPSYGTTSLSVRTVLTEYTP